MDQNGNEQAHSLKQMLLNAIAGGFINAEEARALCVDCFPLSNEPPRYETRIRSLGKLPTDLRNQIVGALFERSSDLEFEIFESNDFDEDYAEIIEVSDEAR